ncbi:hypothetical protein FPV67DRAFT_211194 [Lyophyllum atratum]|nr:hypothetical protein FPV67DRAFT_211194 [Lyophyllum atratum]
MMSIPQLSQPLPILVPKSYEPPDAAADGGLAGGSKEDSEMGRKAPQPLFTFLAGPSAPSHISNALLQMHAPDEEMDVDEVPATAQANGETAGTTEHHMDHLPWPESTADISAKPRRNSDVATAKKKLLSVSQPEKVKQANAGRLQSDMILKEVVSHALAFHPGFNAEIIRRVAEVQAELDQVKANGAILLARLGLAEKYNAALMAQPAKKETNVMESVNGTKEAVAKSKPKPVKYALKASASSPRPKPKVACPHPFRCIHLNETFLPLKAQAAEKHLGGSTLFSLGFDQPQE